MKEKIKKIIYKGKEIINIITSIDFKKISSKFFYFFIGVFASLLAGIFLYSYNEYQDYKKAREENIIFRNEFKTENLEYKEVFTKNLRDKEKETRIVFVQNFDYFRNVAWFSLGAEPEKFTKSFSGILIYEYKEPEKEFKLVYKFQPVDIDNKFACEAPEGCLDAVPLFLEFAGLGDIDKDGKNELITEWSHCNFNHCVWRFPVIIGYDKGGYFVKWTMPEHQLTQRDKDRKDYFWGGQLFKREIVNSYDGKDYILYGGNNIEYKYIDEQDKVSIVSYNIDNDSCWACEHTFLLDLYHLGTNSAYATFHNSNGLEEHFTKISSFNFIDKYLTP